MVDVQAGVEIGLEVAEDSRDLVRSGSFSHESLPGSLPVVRFPLRLDQVLGGRPITLFYCCFFPRLGSTAEVPRGATWLGWRVTRGIRIGLNRGVMLVSGWQMAVRIGAIS